MFCQVVSEPCEGWRKNRGTHKSGCDRRRDFLKALGKMQDDPVHIDVYNITGRNTESVPTSVPSR